MGDATRPGIWEACETNIWDVQKRGTYVHTECTKNESYLTCGIDSGSRRNDRWPITIHSIHPLLHSSVALYSSFEPRRTPCYPAFTPKSRTQISHTEIRFPVLASCFPSTDNTYALLFFALLSPPSIPLPAPLPKPAFRIHRMSKRTAFWHKHPSLTLPRTIRRVD